MKHLQRIDEFISTPYKWDWSSIRGNEWVAEFTTEDDKFWVEISQDGPFEDWELKFSSERREFNKTDVKGPQSAMRILTTVFLEILVSFMDSNPYVDVKFYGSQSAHDKTVKQNQFEFVPVNNNSEETKRDRVYKMLMKQLPDNLKWETRGRMIHVTSKVQMHESLEHEFDLEAMFDDLNDKLFGGELKRIPLMWKTMRGSGGHLKSTRRTTVINGKKTVTDTPDYIAISDFYKKDEKQILDTLAHEMLHLWIVQNNIQDDSYHGLRFKEKMREINKLGIVTIDLKDDVTDLDVSDDKPLTKPVIAFVQEDHTLNRKLLSLIAASEFTPEAKEKIMDAIVGTSKYSKRDFTIRFFECTDSVLRKYPVTRKFKNAHTLKYVICPEGLKPIGKEEVIEVKGGVAEKLTESKFPIGQLEKTARKFDSFEEFSKHYSFDINHGYYWHLTDNKDFKISDEVGPRDMSSMGSGGSSNKGSIMITSDLTYWDDYYNKSGHGTVRPYAVLFDATEVSPSKLLQVSRGFGNEVYLYPEDAKKLKVLAVYDIKTARNKNRTAHNAIPGTESELRELYLKSTKK